jgi:hypothetical protein
MSRLAISAAPAKPYRKDRAMSDLVEQVARAIHDVLENDDDSKGGGYMRAARAALSVLEPRIEALERELAEAREALVAEREETLWSAYSSGLEKDGRWTHMFMSDGEWLAREVGLDPRTGHYDAEYIKAAIPRAARAAVRNGEATHERPEHDRA